MKSPLILFPAVTCLVIVVCKAESTQSTKPKPESDALKRVSPIILLKIMPKVIEKIRERFPRANIQLVIPNVLKEIQDTMQLPQFTSLDTGAMPAFISVIIDRMIARLESLANLQGGHGGASTEQINYIPNEKEALTNKPQITEAVVLLAKATELPDLAFDRDPSRFGPNRRETEEENEDNLGNEPTDKQDKPPESLGEYDQFYKNDK